MTVGHRMPDGWEREQQATGVVGADSAASREREREGRGKGEGEGESGHVLCLSPTRCYCTLLA